jgi:hemin uptake protein HemP
MTYMSAADERSQQAPAHPEAGRPTAARPVRVLVSDILAGGREAILEHDGQDYRLRITANGKLILTK